MEIVTQEAELRASLSAFRRSGLSIGFVPTMGNLHDGHLSLVESAAAQCDRVIVSVFVNPMQFGEIEDLETYPNTPEEDEQALLQHDVAILYRPALEDVYPSGIDSQTRVVVPEITEILEGKSRPGHFTGVATVVNRLFNQVQPDAAFFGKKDYQQYLLIRKMVLDLAMDIQIVGVETVRHENGLAMSSRNSHLSGEQFKQAAELYRLLKEVAVACCDDNKKTTEHEEKGIKQLIKIGFVPDYLVVRRQQDLRTPEDDDVNLIVLVAARLGNTRLLDNFEFVLK